jgi:transcription antitermination factor NusG
MVGKVKLYSFYNSIVFDFQVYAPAIHVKRKLKNGSYSVTPKPLFRGCVFLRFVLNKEIHDFIRECDGVGGFVGSRVGNT